MLEDGVEHDSKHRKEDHKANANHPVMQNVDIRSNGRDGCLEVELMHSRTTIHVVDRGCRTEDSQSESRHGQQG